VDFFSGLAGWRFCDLVVDPPVELVLSPLHHHH
jgi:hypothetical protein